jgi:hypothetical protein
VPQLLIGSSDKPRLQTKANLPWRKEFPHPTDPSYLIKTYLRNPNILNMPRNFTLFLFVIALFCGITAPAQHDLSPWTAKFVVTHPNGIDTDTVWFGADTAGAFGYQLGLDVLDTNLSAPIRILAFDQVVEDSFGFGTCANLSRDIKGFKTGWYEFTFYVVSDTSSSAFGGMAKISWDSTDFMFQNDSFSLDEAYMVSEYGYLNVIDGTIISISGIKTFDSTRFYTSGNINLINDGIAFECNSPHIVMKLTLTILFNYYQWVGIGEAFELKILNIHPNPARDYVIIQLPSDLTGGIIEIINNQGIPIHRGHIMDNSKISIPIAGYYTPGLYLARIIDIRNRIIYFGKFIVSP